MLTSKCFPLSAWWGLVSQTDPKIKNVKKPPYGQCRDSGHETWYGEEVHREQSLFILQQLALFMTAVWKIKCLWSVHNCNWMAPDGHYWAVMTRTSVKGLEIERISTLSKMGLRVKSWFCAGVMILFSLTSQIMSFIWIAGTDAWNQLNFTLSEVDLRVEN